MRFLRPGGYLRIAVPDGNNPDRDYIDQVRPGGIGPGAADHKILYDHTLLSRTLRGAGFEVQLLEYFDADGHFLSVPWDPGAGMIHRSCRYDERNRDGKLNYTSLIIDAWSASTVEAGSHMHAANAAADMRHKMHPAGPAFAIILPALDAAAHLPQALASIATQRQDFAGGVEAVLVDGGSRDATVAIASAEPGLRIISAPGSSIYQALNRGIAETRAPAIVILNTDDVLLPGALAAWHDALARAPECGIARGRATFVEIDPAGAPVPVVRANARAAGPLTAEVLLRGPGFINSLCIRREAFDRIGPFDTTYRLAADRDWMLRACLAGVGVVEFDRPVYRYLSHPDSSTMDRARRNYGVIRREQLAIAAHNLAGIGDMNPAQARALRAWHAAEAGMLSWHQARTLDLRALSRTLWQASRRDLWWPAIFAVETVRWLTARQRE